MRGGVYPPDAKKWRGVDYEAGQVCVDPDIMNVKVTRQDKGRRWVDFEKEDLKRLDPHPPPSSHMRWPELDAPVLRRW
jgi:hypothetical protein